jgi:exodeoxyribonuclease VII small subunit
MAREKNRESKPGGDEPEPDDVKYGAAVTEIEQILASIDRDEIDLDELGAKVERAVDLLKVCRAKLKATEARVVKVLKDLEEESAAAEESDEEEDEASEEEIEEELADEPGSKPAAAAEPPPAASSPKKRRRPTGAPDEELPF